MDSLLVRPKSRLAIAVLMAMPLLMAALLAISGTNMNWSGRCCVVVTIAVVAIIAPSKWTRASTWLRFFSLAALLSTLELALFCLLAAQAPSILVGARLFFLVYAIVMLGVCISIAIRQAPCERKVCWLDRYVDAVLQGTIGLPIVIEAIRFEVLCLLYAVLPRQRLREVAQLDQEFFSSIRQGDSLRSHYVVLAFGAIEMIVLHFIVRLWSPAMAWMLSLICAYALFVLYANSRSMCLRPHAISTESVDLRHGILFGATIEISNIVEVAAVQRREVVPLGASLKGLGCINVCVRTHEPVTVHGPMGRRIRAGVVLLGVDEPQKFVDSVRARLRSVKPNDAVDELRVIGCSHPH